MPSRDMHLPVQTDSSSTASLGAFMGESTQSLTGKQGEKPSLDRNLECSRWNYDMVRPSTALHETQAGVLRGQH